MEDSFELPASTKKRANTVLVIGPQGCGKTTNADALMRAFHCSRVIELDGSDPSYESGDLMLANSLPANVPPHVVVLEYNVALAVQLRISAMTHCAHSDVQESLLAQQPACQDKASTQCSQSAVSQWLERLLSVASDPRQAEKRQVASQWLLSALERHFPERRPAAQTSAQ